MSDHALLGLLVFLSVVIATGGFVVITLQWRATRRETVEGLLEMQRLTKAVGALVIQETAKLRAGQL
jgi:hypothetical protein